MITKEIEIEDLIKEIPQTVTYLMEQGIKYVRCGELLWGTHETAAKEKGFNDLDIELFVKDLSKLINKKMN